jgi:uncharacterized protein YdeI (YjbR/CyaY-like superfamily)
MEKKQAPRLEFYAKNRKTWRKWLEKNHDKTENVWLVIYKKDSEVSSVYYDEAVEEALSFGWIDSKPNKRDEQSFFLFFSRRKPKSKWSALNKTRIEKLLEQGKIHKSGWAMIELAKKTGTWSALEKSDALEFPPELKKAFAKNKTALKNFDAFTKSVKKAILEWIENAKRKETLEKRVFETVSLAEKNIRANQWKK